MKNTKNEQSFWQKTKRFFEPVSWMKFLYFRQFIQACIPAILSIGSIVFLQKISENIGDKNIDLLSQNLIYFGVFLFLGECIIFGIRKWGWMNTLSATIVNILEVYLGQFISAENTSIEKIGTGKLVGIIKDGASEWSELLADIIEKGAPLFINIGFAFYMIRKISLSYAYLFLLLMFLFVFCTFYFNLKLKKFRDKRYEVRNVFLKYFVKILMSKIEIMQTGKLNMEISYLKENSREQCSISKDMATLRTLNKRLPLFSLSFVVIGVLWVFKSEISNPNFDISFLVGFSAVVILMQKTLTDTISFYVDASKRFVRVEKLWDFFDTTPQIQGYEEGNNFVHKKGDIELQNISYGYDANKAVFKNFSLKIPGSQITALVGPSGGGKSTLVKLIAGYIKADSGEVIIDTQKLSETSLKSYYSDIGYLTQEPSVFDGTVKENLLYAISEEISQKEIQNIISLAHCEFIYDLPKGLDTEIGERGIKLSGGQKQRLAIAKIFLKDPKIIILDEPTSALDSLSEKKITEAMHNLFENRTVLVIAHRLQTVKHADDIIVIQNGEVIERGTHTELIKNKGFYKEMLDLQSGF